MIKSLFSPLYVEVAGFIILLRFYEPSLPFAYLKNKLFQQIMLIMDGFVVNKKPIKINFSIDFIEETMLPLYFLKQSKSSFVYAHIYSKVSEKKGLAFYSISLSQFQLLLANIVQELLSHSGGFFLHASASLIYDRAVLFLGPPGAGKSTMVDLLSSAFQPLIDDTAVVVEKTGKYYLYQLPCFEKNKQIKRSRNKYQLGGVCIIKKSKLIKIVNHYDKALLLETIINQVSLFGTVKTKVKYLLISRLISRINCFYLYFPNKKAPLIKKVGSYFFPIAKQ